MQIIKKLGQPLLYASLGLFMAAAQLDGTWMYKVAAVTMLAGMVLFVVGIFIPEEKKAPSSADQLRRSPYVAESPGAPAAGPAGAAAEASDGVPGWVYLVSGVMSGLGALAYMLGPNGVSARTVTTFAMIPGGFVFFLAAKAFYGGVIGQRNVLRSVVAFLGFLLLFGGIMTGVLIFAGAFSPENKLFYSVLAVIALVIGIAMTYYGMKYQQGAEGVNIGRELGFQDADSGLFAADGVYDSKGVVNGVETLFNVEQEQARHSRHGSTPAHFRLEVLCRCANPRGVRLEVQPDGFLNFSLSGLPKAPPPDYWDGYDVRTGQPDVVYPPLIAAKPQESVFNSQNGFAGMSLEANEFEFVFELEGYVSTSFVRGVLGWASKLASAFN